LIEFKRVAQYGKKNENFTEVERGEAGDGEELFITVPFDESLPSDYTGGVMGVKEIAPEIYSIDTNGRGRRPLVHAMLLKTAFRGSHDKRIIITTVSERMPAKVKMHTDMGFTDMGTTRDTDSNGRPLAREKILLNRHGTQLATRALASAGIRRDEFLPDGRNRPSVPLGLNDGY